MRDDRLLDLLDAHLEGRLSPPEADELRAALRCSLQARELYWAYVEQHALLEDVLAEARGADLAFLEESLTDTSLLRPTRPTTARRHLPAWAALAAVAAALLIALTLWPRRAPDPVPRAEPFATIQALAGDVRVSDGAGPPALVSAGTPLSVGQKVHVGDEESQAEILFEGGTLLTVGSGSALRLAAPEGSEGKRILLDAGAVQLDVPGRATDRPVVVAAWHAVVTAADARFRLYREADASRVEVERGKVRLDSRGGVLPVEVSEGAYALVYDEPVPMQTQQLPLGHARLRHTFLRGGDAVWFTSDGRQVVASHFDRGLKAWGAEDGKPIASAPSSGQRTDALAVSVGGVAVALGNGGTASLWKVGDAQATRTSLRAKRQRSGAVSPDGRWLAQGTAEGVDLWEVDPEKGSLSLRRSLPVKPSRVALSGTGALVAVSRWGGEIHVFEVRTEKEVGRHKLSKMPTPLALSADGDLLAAYANTDGLVLFDRKAGRRRDLWAGEGARVWHLAFSRDGGVLLAGLDDGTVRAWSSTDGRPLLVLDTGHRHINKVAVTADLSLLATVGDNDCVKVWEVTLP